MKEYSINMNDEKGFAFLLHLPVDDGIQMQWTIFFGRYIKRVKMCNRKIIVNCWILKFVNQIFLVQC